MLVEVLSALDYGYCLHGETKIHTLNGDIPIRDLVGKRPWVFSWDGERVRLAKAKRVWMTKRNASCLRVVYGWYRGGKKKSDEIICTPEHLFMLRDGNYCQAKKLETGDSLMPFAQKDVGRERIEVQIQRGYGKAVWRGRSHWVIEEQGIVLGEDEVVHHKNENKKDDRPENLKIMTEHDHFSLHSKKWFASATPEMIKARAEKAVPKFKLWCENNREKTSDIQRKLWADPKIRANRMKGLLKAAAEGRIGSSGWKHTPEVCARISAAKTKYWNQWRERQQTLSDNHKVVLVEAVGCADVFDMEVPGFHNFSANHVVVHNSVGERIYAEQELGEWKGKLVLKRVQSLKPHYVDFLVDQFGQLQGVQQQMTGAYNDPMPTAKFLIYSHAKEFGNFYGMSDLEAAYRPWWTKDNAYKWLAVTLERYGMAPLFALYDPNAYPGGMVEELKKVVRGIQNATLGVIPRATADSLELWSQSLNKGSSELFLAALERFDQHIARALLVPSMIGMSADEGKTGSLARSESHQDSFLYVVTQLQQDLAVGVMNAQLIPQLCDLNFPNLQSYPVFKFMPFTDAQRLEVLAQWAEMVGGKIVNKIEDDEIHIRKMLGFPENENPEVIEEEPPAPPGGGPFGGGAQPPKLGPDGQPLKLGSDGKPLKAPFGGKLPFGKKPASFEKKFEQDDWRLILTPEDGLSEEMHAFAEEHDAVWVYGEEGQRVAVPYAEWNEEDHPRDTGGEGGGQFVPKGGISVAVKEDVLKSTQKHGALFGQPNTEIQREGDRYIVNKRIGAGVGVLMAQGFKSEAEARGWVNSKKGLILERGVKSSGDPNADELERDE